MRNHASLLLQAGLAGLLSLFLGSLFSCNRDFSMETVESIARMENPVYRDKPVPSSVLDQLRPLAESYHQRVKQYADNAEQLQLLYKNVAQRYLDIGYYEQQIEFYIGQIEANKAKGPGDDPKVYYDYAAVMLMQKKLYGEAYDNLLKSLALAPDNTFLLYYAGFAAAQQGKAVKPENETEAGDWLEKALGYYQAALAIDPDYVDALYGQAIILTYEMGRPADAIPALLRIKEKNVKNIDAMFVLASAYVMTENFRSAQAEYEEILRLSGSDEKKKAAQENIDRIKAMGR